MTRLVGTYSLRNLIQSIEFLLKLTKNLSEEIYELEVAKDDVKKEQTEAQKQGLLVKKMANYMSEELERLESRYSKNKNSSSTSSFNKNIEKLSETESKLKVLRERLNEFIEGDDGESLKAADSSLSVELKRYESFFIEVTNVLNEKIATLEKIVSHLQAEKRESRQQKLLLKEMAELFNDEMKDLEKTFQELKS